MGVRCPVGVWHPRSKFENVLLGTSNIAQCRCGVRCFVRPYRSCFVSPTLVFAVFVRVPTCNSGDGDFVRPIGPAKHSFMAQEDDRRYKRCGPHSTLQVIGMKQDRALGDGGSLASFRRLCFLSAHWQPLNSFCSSGFPLRLTDN
jgi:hypothetical protein